MMDDQQRFAEQLCEGEAVADWQWIVTFDDNYEAVTAEEIMRVAAQYFSPDNLTVGHYIPLPPPAKEDAAETPEAAEEAETVVAPKALHVATASGDDTLSAATFLPAADAQIPTFASRVKRLQLANGLTILVMPVAGCGVVSISGKVRAGRYFADLDHSQIPALTASLLTHGSARFTKNEIADRMLTLGTRLRFVSETFAASFGASMAKTGFDEFVDVLADVIRHPAFADDELRQFKQEYTAALQAQAADPASVGRIRMLQGLYPAGHAFYEKALPDQASEANGSVRQSLVDFHQRCYTPRNTILVVVGDIEPAAVEALFDKHLGTWQGGERGEIIVEPVAIATVAQRIEVPMADKASVEISIAVPSPLKRSDSDYFAASLANAALGLDTISSRLGAVVREQHGLTYGIYSRFGGALFGNGPWVITMSVNPDNADKALALVGEVMDEYRASGMTARELADEAGRAYGLSVVRLRSTQGIAEAIALNEFSGLGVEAMDSLAPALRAVTLEQANDALRKYLRTDAAVTVLSGVQS